MANGHEGDAVNGGQAADDGRVIQPCSIPMQLDKAVTDVEDDVQEGGPVGVSRHLQTLHWCQPCVCIPPQLQQQTQDLRGFVRNFAISYKRLGSMNEIPAVHWRLLI